MVYACRAAYNMMQSCSPRQSCLQRGATCVTFCPPQQVLARAGAIQHNRSCKPGNSPPLYRGCPPSGTGRTRQDRCPPCGCGGWTGAYRARSPPRRASSSTACIRPARAPTLCATSAPGCFPSADNQCVCPNQPAMFSPRGVSLQLLLARAWRSFIGRRVHVGVSVL